ncbi:endonuclease III [Tepidanaerobacter acetatoxydans]|nr:endonuclease III [Tepidanaerobacter acetatoxydans]AEE91637.1 endonuclease III [Tepidanaerobacter acetatoxydans Re1]
MMKKDKITSEEKERERITAIISKLSKLYPEATTALNHSSPFELLIATILSAQCTDKRVNKVTERLFKKYKGPKDFAEANKSELEQDIKECGIFKNKSKNIIETSKILFEKYNGQVPSNFDELIELPGVGRKTANVVLANAFGKPAFAVDTHVYRLAHRLGFSDKKNLIEVERDLREKIPENLWIKAHHWLIYHGRNICRARKPLCDECLLSDLCLKFQKAINADKNCQ